jgi:hypothetical protein
MIPAIFAPGLRFMPARLHFFMLPFTRACQTAQVVLQLTQKTPRGAAKSDGRTALYAEHMGACPSQSSQKPSKKFNILQKLHKTDKHPGFSL